MPYNKNWYNSCTSKVYHIKHYPIHVTIIIKQCSIVYRCILISN